MVDVKELSKYTSNDFDSSALRNIPKEMLSRFGHKQYFIVMEECSELIQAVSKHVRYGDRIDSLIEEIADVLICIDTVMYDTGILQEDIKKMMAYKINRLQNKINANEVMV